jgi:hypothetical protein
VTSSYVSSKRSKSGYAGFGQQGSAARKVAVDSFQNIANVEISKPATTGSAEDAEELKAISGVLHEAAKPLSVAEIAERLAWDSAKAANALARGGQYGLLRFSKVGETTKVELADASVLGPKNE